MRRCTYFAAAILFAALPGPQSAQTQAGSTQDIFDTLAPGGVIPARLNLPAEKKTHVIKSLIAARSEAGKERQQEIAYLLATLGYEYQRNRDDLLIVWRGCAQEIPTGGCDDMTGDYLMKLYLPGHKELLRPLIAAYPTGNVALQEGLGGFMGDRLAANTRELLDLVSTFPLKSQRRICYAAGAEDGSGMPAKDFEQATHNLKAIGGGAAARCAQQVIAAKRDAEDAERQSAKP